MSRRGGRASGEPGRKSLDQRWNRHSNCSQQPRPSTTPLDRSSCFMASSQAGRAIAACAAAGGMNDWQLKGHGIEVSNLDQKPGLPDLIVANDGKGSFTQLVPLLHSGSLPAGAPRREDMADHSGFGSQKRRPAPVPGYLPTLRLEYLSEDGRPNFSSWIEGMPQRFGSPNYTEDEFVTFCSSYPTLAGSTGRRVSSQAPLPDVGRQSVRVRRAWTLAADQEPGEFRDVLTRPYLGDDDRYVFPSIGGDTQALHPLLAWWAVLFALSLLARYQPDTWTRYLDVDSSAYAEPLETLLDRALHCLPAALAPCHPISELIAAACWRRPCSSGDEITAWGAVRLVTTRLTVSLPPAARSFVLSIVGARLAGRITGNSCAPERYETGRRGSYSPGPMPPGIWIRARRGAEPSYREASRSRRAPTTSAADAVAKVGDATLTFENSDPLQLALFGAEVLEQPPPVAERGPGSGGSRARRGALR